MVLQEMGDYISQKNGCTSCMEPYDVGTMLPESTMVTCNKDNCDTKVTDTKGLGQGRNYGNSVPL